MAVSRASMRRCIFSSSGPRAVQQSRAHVLSRPSASVAPTQLRRTAPVMRTTNGPAGCGNGAMRPTMLTAGGHMRMRRLMSTQIDISKLRNIGISAHIDSGKTTLTERILYYTGRIKAVHEVRGKDGVGAKMDSMELERERGITIQSAATFAAWKDYHINLIDTPGHVDFTIEVERALRVLDGAVLVICGVGAVQSQSITVMRQMNRYNVPRVCFVNKLDRAMANPHKCAEALRTQLNQNAVLMQLPIGLDRNHVGVVDLVTQEALYFEGADGLTIRKDAVPDDMKEDVAKYRGELLEALVDVDEKLGEKFLMEEEITQQDIKDAVRRATIALKMTPVFMGSAYKNKGVQPLLDAVVDYLPNPTEVKNKALDLENNEEEVVLDTDPKKPAVALAFKLEQGKYGQVTYMRVYQGKLAKGDTILNMKTNKKVRIPRVVRMHSNEMEDIPEAPAGEICALFGVDCDSGTTFTGDKIKYSMTSMHIPEPVISMAVEAADKKQQTQFSKAMDRFAREDPTFRRFIDAETNENICEGMGELHLQIYVERIKREYGVDCIVGKPKVHYREACRRRTEFNYQHKKQSGGRGQYAKVIGYIEPLEDSAQPFEYVNKLVGNNVPPEFHAAIEKGMWDSQQHGPLVGCPVTGTRVVVTDGAIHEVDSSELAFRIASQAAFKQAFSQSAPYLLEPIMNVEIEAPAEFQGDIISNLTRRRGMISDSQPKGTNDVVIKANVPLSEMFGYSTDLRSVTSGKGEFTMEYWTHQTLPQNEQEKVVTEYEQRRQAETDAKK